MDECIFLLKFPLINLASGHYLLTCSHEASVVFHIHGIKSKLTSLEVIAWLATHKCTPQSAITVLPSNHGQASSQHIIADAKALLL